jgi:lyso-ornithine lipid O-acyltransferase
MNPFRGYLRLFCMSLLILLFFAKVLIYKLLYKNYLSKTLPLRQKLAQTILFCLGVNIRQKGVIPTGNYLFISNHRSYTDVAVASCFLHILPVAKEEVLHWPLIGAAAQASGAFFVKRNDKDSRKHTREAIRQALQQGISVLIYPEGTTHLERQTQAFRQGIFQVAADDHIAVVPLAIEYARSADAWVGKDTFIRHFVECFGHKKTFVYLSFGEKIQNTNSQELHNEVKRKIDEQMSFLQVWIKQGDLCVR